MSRLLLFLFIWFIFLGIAPELTLLVTIVFGCWLGIWTALKFVFKL